MMIKAPLNLRSSSDLRDSQIEPIKQPMDPKDYATPDPVLSKMVTLNQQSRKQSAQIHQNSIFMPNFDSKKKVTARFLPQINNISLQIASEDSPLVKGFKQHHTDDGSGNNQYT